MNQSGKSARPWVADVVCEHRVNYPDVQDPLNALCQRWRRRGAPAAAASGQSINALRQSEKGTPS